MTSTDPSASDTDEHAPSLAAEFDLAKATLLSRCKAAGLEADIKSAPESTQQIIRVLMKCGRGSRAVNLFSKEAIDSFLSVSFEKFIFLGELDAICSYEEATIEAAVRPISVTPGFFWRRIFGDDSDETLKSAKLSLPPAADGLPSIELSRASPNFYRLVRGFGPPRRMTIKLTKVSTKTHDSALELLNKISGSFFLQLDMIYGSALGLVKERRRLPPTRFKRTTADVRELQYPKTQYDSAPLSLYWYGRSAEGMPLLQYLAFYQAIEFYFPIYSRSEAQRKLKMILKDPLFRTDRDSDIARLLSAVNVSRSGAVGDERSQLRATLMECCDSDELRSFFDAEPSRRDFFSSRSKTQPYHKIPVTNPTVDLRNDVAERIYEIRCKIVHMKTDSRDSTLELLLPFSTEAEQLAHDIELVQYLASKVLIASSAPLNIHS